MYSFLFSLSKCDDKRPVERIKYNSWVTLLICCFLSDLVSPQMIPMRYSSGSTIPLSQNTNLPPEFSTNETVRLVECFAGRRMRHSAASDCGVPTASGCYQTMGGGSLGGKAVFDNGKLYLYLCVHLFLDLWWNFTIIFIISKPSISSGTVTGAQTLTIYHL